MFYFFFIFIFFLFLWCWKWCKLCCWVSLYNYIKEYKTYANNQDLVLRHWNDTLECFECTQDDVLFISIAFITIIAQLVSLAKPCGLILLFFFTTVFLFLSRSYSLTMHILLSLNLSFPCCAVSCSSSSFFWAFAADWTSAQIHHWKKWLQLCWNEFSVRLPGLYWTGPRTKSVLGLSKTHAALPLLLSPFPSCPLFDPLWWRHCLHPMNRMNILEELEMLKDYQCFRTVSYSYDEIVLFSFYFLKLNE